MSLCARPTSLIFRAAVATSHCPSVRAASLALPWLAWLPSLPTAQHFWMCISRLAGQNWRPGEPGLLNRGVRCSQELHMKCRCPPSHLSISSPLSSPTAVSHSRPWALVFLSFFCLFPLESHFPFFFCLVHARVSLVIGICMLG
ncbi:hypothetical protein F5Y03DRAFT_215488 [Xylaria venustula]|nr:hypothetical protein F5Y03DRAFT_215488 [Xylaria venustula]